MGAAQSPSSTLKTNTSSEGFGSKRVRSSFGRGFFKLRGGKQAASATNLSEDLSTALQTIRFDFKTLKKQTKNPSEEALLTTHFVFKWLPSNMAVQDGSNLGAEL